VPRVLISGASGLIGSALVSHLTARGYAVTRLVRSRSAVAADAVYWNPVTEEIDAARCEEFDAVVHLAGRNLSAGRLTGRRQREAFESRVRGTALLATTLAGLERRPRVFISASAIGFYGDRGDELITEATEKGQGFLADLCAEWEAATEVTGRAGIRVVRLRTAVVLSRAGGALKSMLPVFRMGLGGPLGNGRQWFSWIALEDHVRAFLQAIETESLMGPVNSTSPEPVRQKDFARMLGKVLSRPAVIPVPKIVLGLRFGQELGEATLWSQRVLPEKLQGSGFEFKYPNLEAALWHESKKLRMTIKQRYP